MLRPALPHALNVYRLRHALLPTAQHTHSVDSHNVVYGTQAVALTVDAVALDIDRVCLQTGRRSPIADPPSRRAK